MALRFASLPKGVSAPIPTSYLNSAGSVGTSTWFYGPSLPSLSTAINFGGSLGTLSFPFKRPIESLCPINTPATILILSDPGSKIQYSTNKFILQSITKPHNEKVQIMETFSNSHLFFFGERTKIYTMQGVVLDAFFRSDHDSDFIGTNAAPELKYKYQWALAFQDFYNNILAGTKLAAAGNIAALYVNGWLIKGYPIQFTLAKESQAMPDAATFQMTWIVREESLINASQAAPLYKNDMYKDPAVVRAMNDFVNALAEYEKVSDEFYASPSDQKKSKEAAVLNQEKVVFRTKMDLVRALAVHNVDSPSGKKIGALDWE